MSENLDKKERWEDTARRRTLKRRILVVLVTLGIGAAALGTVKLVNAPTDQTPSILESLSDADWVKGDRQAQTVLIEYSDFQCPACKAYYPLVKQLAQDFSSQIVFVYRHFPLSGHQYAKLAARAAEAAGRQGKFWEMHDLIFENQNAWSNQENPKNIFTGFARSLLLDTDQFSRDLDSKEVKDKVDNDYQSGVRAEVNYTPTFFLNGQRISNPRSYKEFQKLINQAIKNP